MSDDQLRTLLARRSLRHPLRPHLRTPTVRESVLLSQKRAQGTPQPLPDSSTRH